VIDWFQLFCGYLITGTVNQKMAVFLAGPKDCGKTTFLEAFGDMMGTYAGTATPNLILEPKGSRIIEDEANCHGRRLVAVSEAPPEVPLDIGRFKRLTGGDTLVGERKFQSQFSFAPTHKIVYACNDFPRVNVLDPAVWSRVRVVPFSVPKAIDRTLRGTLQTEAPGILVWAANGLRRLQSGEDLTLVPEAMKTAANDWRDKSDWIYDWHDEHCIRNPSAETKASDAIKSLRAYRTRKASPIGASDKAILAAIQALGYSKILHPKHRVTYFRGLEVR
jgi:putative DNA primase/helicase